MRKALAVLTVAVALTLACATATAPEDQATSSGENQTAYLTEQTTETRGDITGGYDDLYCINITSILSAVDIHLYNMADYVIDGLDDPINMTLLENESETNSSYTEESLGWIDVPSDIIKLHRSLENYSEQLTEFDANLEQYSHDEIRLLLEKLIDDFLVIHAKVHDYCEAYRN